MKKLVTFLLGVLFAASSFAAAPKLSPELLKQGKTAYTSTCASCHGDKGDGNGMVGKYMNPKPRDFSKGGFKNGDKIDQIYSTISNGLKGTAMVAYSNLPENDRWAIAYYVQDLKKNKSAKK